MKVRLIRRIDKKAGRVYIGYSINFPKGIIESLNFSSSDFLELEVRVVDGRPVIVIYKP
ncbi:MAG: hypothetical protein QXO22_04155 [Thermosphaera sp.]